VCRGRENHEGGKCTSRWHGGVGWTDVATKTMVGPAGVWCGRVARSVSGRRKERGEPACSGQVRSNPRSQFKRSKVSSFDFSVQPSHIFVVFFWGAHRLSVKPDTKVLSHFFERTEKCSKMLSCSLAASPVQVGPRNKIWFVRGSVSFRPFPDFFCVKRCGSGKRGSDV
jgi:hypothetical protein